MAKFSSLLLCLSAGAASAFVSKSSVTQKTALRAAEGVWDPMGFLELSSGKSFDTFPNVFPDEQFLRDAEIKHGRQAMLAWTGVWATTEGGLGLGMHFPGAPVCADWTKALGVFASEEPETFGILLALIALAEGESVGHSGDNFRGKSTKSTPGDLNFDYLGLKKKFSAEKFEKYQNVEIKNGRAAMIAMASLFAWKAIPGSVPMMDILS